jgi:hypothetical protein
MGQGGRRAEGMTFGHHWSPPPWANCSNTPRATKKPSFKGLVEKLVEFRLAKIVKPLQLVGAFRSARRCRKWITKREEQRKLDPRAFWLFPLSRWAAQPMLSPAFAGNRFSKRVRISPHCRILFPLSN